MDKSEQLLEARIRKIRENRPLLQNEQELTDRVMAHITTDRPIGFPYRNRVRLILNAAAVGLIAYFFLQTGEPGPSGATGKNNHESGLVSESQAGRLLQQSSDHEALPSYLGFLQQRSRENKASRSSRPTTKTYAL